MPGPGRCAPAALRAQAAAQDFGLNTRRGAPIFTGTGRQRGHAMGQAPPCYHVFETAAGFCGIAWSDAGICRFQLPTPERRGDRAAAAAAACPAPSPATPPPEVADGGRRGAALLRRRAGRLLRRPPRSRRAGRLLRPRSTPPPARSAGARPPPTARSPATSAPARRPPATSARRWRGTRSRSSSPATACSPPAASSAASPRPAAAPPRPDARARRRHPRLAAAASPPSPSDRAARRAAVPQRSVNAVADPRDLCHDALQPFT